MPRSQPLRVLVLAPTGRDSEVLVQTASKSGITAEACANMAALCEEIAKGAGAAVVAGEALGADGQRALARALQAQPEWSDFPLVVMETPRRELGRSAGFDLGFPSYAIVLVRPVHAQTLVSALRSALRSRVRQYQVRDELVDRRRVEDALREANARKDEFLAMLGHELRNPLAAIRSATEIMKLLAPEDAQLQRAQGVLDRQSAHMARLIDGLLEVSRIARGKIQLEETVLDARNVVGVGLQDRISQIESRGLTLTTESPNEPLWVRADQVRLVQVLDNLIGNAIKFTESPGTLHVTLRKEGDDAVIRVKDTGSGIRPEMLERVFEPFQQDTHDIARPAGGLGLGLALAKGLVELQRGSIRAHSAGRGTGAEFEVRLPLVAAPSEKRGVTPSTPPVTPMRVLIVEDNPDAGQSLRDLLEVLGHQATVAVTGLEAIDVLRQHGADAVLCDLGLPGMSGYGVARAVRGDATLKRTPLVALTGYGQAEDRERTASAGFDAHLTKPVDVESLNQVLSRFEGRKLGNAATHFG